MSLRKNLLFIAIFISLVLLIGFGFLTAKRKASSGINLVVGERTLTVEIARTSRQREQGLSDRKKMCSDCGMLFVFDQPGIYPFWMRGMFFDIDILWIVDNRVVDITFAAKAPSKEEFVAPKTTYQSKVLIDRALEVNAGWVEKNGIEVGDTVKY